MKGSPQCKLVHYLITVLTTLQRFIDNRVCRQMSSISSLTSSIELRHVGKREMRERGASAVGRSETLSITKQVVLFGRSLPRRAAGVRCLGSRGGTLGRFMGVRDNFHLNFSCR